MTTGILPCELHDYIEIACTFRLPIVLLLESGKELEGIAVNTLSKPDKAEYLMFVETGTENAIPLAMNNLVEMKALVKNPHFDTVHFR